MAGWRRQPDDDPGRAPVTAADLDPDLGDRTDASSNSRPTVADVAVVAAGGAVGTVARYGMSVVVPTAGLPWATLLVNVSGALVLGVVLVTLSGGGRRGRLVRLAVGTGAIGAFTTMSALAVETDELARSGRLPAAMAYLALTMVLGLGAAWAGGRLGRSLSGPARSGRAAA